MKFSSAVTVCNTLEHYPNLFIILCLHSYIVPLINQLILYPHFIFIFPLPFQKCMTLRKWLRCFKIRTSTGAVENILAQLPIYLRRDIGHRTFFTSPSPRFHGPMSYIWPALLRNTIHVITCILRLIPVMFHSHGDYESASFVLSF